MTKQSNLPLFTDADEQVLIAQAFEARYAYPLDRAVMRAFRKAVQFFHRDQVSTAGQLSHHAAQ
ncbi:MULTISPECIES: hypothetical protein [unclassified Castellaniella]|uniref:hypothetical protein n=1 Tax=unclassified Castellaniella TaxID=2617606 RepID=UPI0033153712